MKDYNAEKGIALDANFSEHWQTCDQCRRFVPANHSSLALLCLEGSILWKAANVAPVKRGIYAGRTTKTQVSEATRYK